MKNSEMIGKMNLNEFNSYCQKLINDENSIKEIDSYLNQICEEQNELAIFYMTFEYAISDTLINDDLAEIFQNKFTRTLESHEEKHLIYQVLDELNLSPIQVLQNNEAKRLFTNYLLSIFYYTIKYSIVDLDDEEKLASFICSFTCSVVNEWSGIDNFIVDEIVDCLKYAFGKDLNDYEGDDGETFSIFIYVGVSNLDTPYNYFAMSRDIIDDYI